MNWDYVIGFVYTILGLITTLCSIGFILWHQDNCDNCVFNTNPFDEWSESSPFMRCVALLSYLSIFIWPLTIIFYCCVMLPMIVYERRFAKPMALSLVAMVRAWFKRKNFKHWSLSGGDHDVEYTYYGAKIIARICVTNSVILRIDPRFASKSKPRPMATLVHVDAADPQIFEKIEKFIETVSKKYRR